jgi:3-hydroxybutyryl-CoA dehydrogenase
MSRPFQRIGVAGAGAMGRGIVQIFAQAGYPVCLYDTQPAAAQAALSSIRDTFAMLASKGRLTADQARQASERVTLIDATEGFSGCDLVIEAIIERLDIKRDFFKALEAVLAPDAVMASNTSSLSITALAGACRHPQRVAGYHFFNPVPLMRIVEVIAAPRTDPRVCERLSTLAREAGHTPVTAQDTPGFIVNHAGRGFGPEALRVLGEGVAPHWVIDRVMREQVSFEGQGFKLGPFELLDLTGLDVSHPVMESIYRQYYEEPRYKPSVIGAQRVAAGLFGRKSSEGFYRYGEGAPALEEPAAPEVQTPPPVWIAPGPSQAALAQVLTEAGVRLDRGADPGGDSLIVIAPRGLDATTAACESGLDASRVVAIDTLFAFGWRACKRRSIMTTPATRTEYRDAAHAVFARDGAKVSVLADSAGFVSQRIVAMIVAVGCEIAQAGIASPADIDTAVRLGLGYPMGPLAMGDHLGAGVVGEILAGMYRVTGEPRYRPSLWLQRRAALGMSLLEAHRP